jgi:hypothetical protein
MTNIVKGFSYPLSELSTMTQAEDRAKELGISFSKYLVNCVKQDLKKKMK